MITIEQLEKSLEDCPEVYWIQYSNMLGSGTFDFIFFIEGEEDPIYYPSRLNQINASHKAHFILCKGKDNVISARDEVKPRYTSYQLSRKIIPIPLFIVDRDIDPYHGLSLMICEHLFETQYYSFESYYINESVFQMIWQIHFGLPLDTTYYSYLSRFHTLLATSIPLLLNMSALSLHFKSIGVKFRFSDFKGSQLFKIDVTTGRVEANNGYALKKLKKTLRENKHFKLDRVAIFAHYRRIQSEDPLCTCRGKWLLALMVRLLDSIKSELIQQRIIPSHPQIDVPWFIKCAAPYAHSKDFDGFINQHEKAI
jgi:hypothetical protein